MSRRSELQARMMAVVAAQGGSHLTRESRERTVRRFVDIVSCAGFTHLRRVQDISGKQIRSFTEARLKGGIAIRTIHNELAHLRELLRRGGRASVANAPEISNKRLGLAGASRKGTKIALPPEEYTRVRALAMQHRRPGMAALMCLERWFGLRGNEAIHARTDTLERWRLELQATGKVNVLAGTKGGRPRLVTIHNRSAAIAALEEALVVARSQGGFLVSRKDGKRASGLKSARAIYHAWAHRAGIQPHAARYAFAQDQMATYERIGYSEREALVATALDLGHGDGRGRWVRSVYAPRADEPTRT